MKNDENRRSQRSAYEYSGKKRSKQKDGSALADDRETDNTQDVSWGDMSVTAIYPISQEQLCELRRVIIDCRAITDQPFSTVESFEALRAKVIELSQIYEGVCYALGVGPCESM